MLSIKKMNGRGEGVRPFVLCLILYILTFFVTALVSSVILNALSDPLSALPIASLVTLVVSAALSGGISSLIFKTKNITLSASVTLTASFLMLIFGIIASKGEFSIGAFMNCLCYVGVSILSALLTRRKRRKKRR